MFESIRKQGASVFIYLIFGLLIAIFVINMGNGSSKGAGGGCSGASNTTLSVEGKAVNHTSFLVAFSSMRGEGLSVKQRQQLAIERLLKREILAAEAEKRGIRVSGGLVEDGIKKGEFYMAGERTPLNFLFEQHDDGERTWNYKAFKGWISNLNVSPTSYEDEQGRELQAVLMAEVLQNSVPVSRDEALQNFIFRGNTVTYDLVGFPASAYRAAMRLTEDDVARFLAKHEDDVKARFKADERLYDDKPAQLQLRQIFIAKAEAPKPDDKKPDDKKPDDKKADDKKADKKVVADVKPVGMPIDEAKAKLEAVRTAATADKTKFVAAAKELSTDESAKAMGGALGWHTVTDAQLSEKAVTDAVKSLKVGEMTPVIATDAGVYLVLAEATREKKVTYDQAKVEIATELARDVWSKEKAKRMAIAAFDQAHAGTGKNLGDIFEKEPVEPAMPQGLDPSQFTPEQMKQIQEMMKQQKHGSTEKSWESKDQLATWGAAEGDGAGGSGSGSGSGTGTGSGSGSGSAVGTPAPNGAGFTPPTGADAIVASADELPAFGEVKPPKVQRAPEIHRSAHMPSLGTNSNAAKALFEELTPGMLAKRIYTDEDEFVVVQLISRASVKKEDFEKDADQAIEALRKRRGAQFLTKWLSDRCQELKRDDKIKPADDLIRETDDKGKPLPTTYVPCFTLGPASALEQ